ncbi:MAG TPA: iron uptake protein [Burkholderiales bacterium]|nr:iron uptake protein [Burkholderiales bacterium]
MASASLATRTIVSRIAASMLGGYAFVWGFVTLGVALLLAAGMSFEDAHHLMYVLAFVVFLVVFCWAFAAASLARVWLVLAGGGAVMSIAAWFVSRALL